MVTADRSSVLQHRAYVGIMAKLPSPLSHCSQVGPALIRLIFRLFCTLPLMHFEICACLQHFFYTYILIKTKILMNSILQRHYKYTNHAVCMSKVFTFMKKQVSALMKLSMHDKEQFVYHFRSGTN